MGCECGTNVATCQVILDKILYDVDRAIDLYAFGIKDFGEPEQRAAAYAYIINAINAVFLGCIENRSTIGIALGKIKEALLEYEFTQDDFNDIPGDPQKPPVIESAGWPTSFSLLDFLAKAIDPRRALKLYYEDAKKAKGVYGYLKEIVCSADESEIPSGKMPESLKRLEKMLEIFHQEFCFQLGAEKQWENMIKNMISGCIRFDRLLGPTSSVIYDAMKRALGEVKVCPKPEVTIPPTVETSIDRIVDDVASSGDRR